MHKPCTHHTPQNWTTMCPQVEKSKQKHINRKHNTWRQWITNWEKYRLNGHILSNCFTLQNFFDTWIYKRPQFQPTETQLSNLTYQWSGFVCYQLKQHMTYLQRDISQNKEENRTTISQPVKLISTSVGLVSRRSSGL